MRDTKQSSVIKGNVYSLIWEADEVHGRHRRVHRVIAKSALDAIKATQPVNAMGKDKSYDCVSVDLLLENLEIRISEIIENAIICWADERPYHTKDLREQLGGEEKP